MLAERASRLRRTRFGGMPVQVGLGAGGIHDLVQSNPQLPSEIRMLYALTVGGGCMAIETEFRAYNWIEAELKSSGWDTRNPNKCPTGQVWNQNEAAGNAELKKALGGQKPESVCKVSDVGFLVIEAKLGLAQLQIASAEAREYCETINQNLGLPRARLATGIAGDEQQGYTASSWLLVEDVWQEVFEGDEPCRRLLEPAESKRLLHRENAQVVPAHLSVKEAVQLASRINSILHSAKIEKERRALTVAFLILALHQDPGLEYSSTAKIFIDDINNRASHPFNEMGRQAMWNEIKISYSEENLSAKAGGLSSVLEILKAAEISSLAQDQDILGNFFEAFLKYGNTSKDLGVVLTPRHICKLAAEACAVTSDDVVLDIAAGTGGFLVAAYNRVKAQRTIEEARAFASTKLFGCEDSGPVAALAFINMYLRGDGKHNLKADSCFNWDLCTSAEEVNFQPRKKNGNPAPAAMKILMNPPFALKTDVQAETDFIDHALRQLKANGLLFAILPASVFYDRSTRDWRSSLLKRHSLLAVVSLPKDLFYPVATETIGVFVRAWSMHDVNGDVMWVRIADDGYEKKKRFRVERSKGASAAALKPITSALRNWINSGIQSAEQTGAIEFKPIASEELIPHAHLGTAALEDASLKTSALKVVRSMLVESWGRPEGA